MLSLAVHNRTVNPAKFPVIVFPEQATACYVTAPTQVDPCPAVHP
jgi:hypothetical protein